MFSIQITKQNTPNFSSAGFGLYIAVISVLHRIFCIFIWISGVVFISNAKEGPISTQWRRNAILTPPFLLFSTSNPFNLLLQYILLPLIPIWIWCPHPPSPSLLQLPSCYNNSHIPSHFIFPILSPTCLVTSLQDGMRGHNWLKLLSLPVAEGHCNDLHSVLQRQA